MFPRQHIAWGKSENIPDAEDSIQLADNASRAQMLVFRGTQLPWLEWEGLASKVQWPGSHCTLLLVWRKSRQTVGCRRWLLVYLCVQWLSGQLIVSLRWSTHFWVSFLVSMPTGDTIPLFFIPNIMELFRVPDCFLKKTCFFENL